jgi:hypothetical protein
MVFERVGRHVGVPMREAEQGGTVTPPVLPPGGSSGPDLPTAEVDVTIPTVTGTTWTVTDEATFTAALSGSAYGDVIEIQSGITLTGNFTFPVKTGWEAGKWVLIRPSNHAALASAWPLEADGLPSASQLTSIATNPRMTPSRATTLALPLIQPPSSPGGSAQNPALTVARGASGLYVWGLRMRANPGFAPPAENFGAFNVSTSGATSPADLSSHVVANQCVLGDRAVTNARRACVQQGSHMAAVNSTAIAMDVNFADSNAIWNAYGTGPFTYINNTEIANGENHFIGGIVLPSWHTGVIPSDFTFRYCHFYKPPTTLEYHPDFAGTVYGCKNPWEMKYGLRVLVEYCVADGNIANNQGGQSWSIKQTTQQGAAFTWCESGHLTFRYNRSIHTVGGLSIYAEQQIAPGAVGIPTHDFVYEHNVDVIDISGDYTNPATTEPNRTGLTIWRSGSDSDGDADLRWRIEHNTLTGIGRLAMLADNKTFRGVTIQNNIFGEPEGVADGITTAGHINGGALTACFTQDCVFTGNAIMVRTSSAGHGNVVTDATKFTSWPGNVFPADNDAAGLNDDGTLDSDSALKAGGAYQATDGTANGADVATVTAATSGVIFTEDDL